MDTGVCARAQKQTVSAECRDVCTEGKDQVNRELLFAQKLESVRRTAKEQGNCIRGEQVKAEFAALDLNPAQLEMVYDYLREHKIGIGEPVDPDAYLTGEERDYLQDYLDKIAALPVCSEGERQAYTVSAMAGDLSAQRRLVESCLSDVADIAKLYVGQGVPLEDLIGEGNVALTVGVGMLGALEKPSEAQAMLARQIMDSMERLIRDNADSGKIDKKIADRVNQVADKARELARELHRKVTPEELGQETGISVKAIQDAMRMSGFRIEEIEGQYGQDGV